MKEARASVGVFAACLQSLLDKDGDDIDQQAALFMIADSVLMWRKSVTGK